VDEISARVAGGGTGLARGIVNASRGKQCPPAHTSAAAAHKVHRRGHRLATAGAELRGVADQRGIERIGQDKPAARCQLRVHAIEQFVGVILGAAIDHDQIHTARWQGSASSGLSIVCSDTRAVAPLGNHSGQCHRTGCGTSCDSMRRARMRHIISFLAIR
jgi:hypothetical protein